MNIHDLPDPIRHFAEAYHRAIANPGPLGRDIDWLREDFHRYNRECENALAELLDWLDAQGIAK